MTLLEKNLAALGSTEAEKLREAGEPAAEVRVEPTDSGYPTATYDGRYLHPRRKPRSRAFRVFTAEWVREHQVVVFFGFGLGYEVEAFLSREEADAAVVVEPDPAVFRTALSGRDLTHVLSSPKAVFLVSERPDALATVLRRFERHTPSLHAANAVARAHHAYFKEVEAVLEAAKDRARINANTLKRFGRLWVRNLIRNAAELARAPGVKNLAGSFSGSPALLCAAGPSLDVVLPHIKELSRRLLLVAVDTALPPLLEHGVEPDFAVIVDPQYWNTRHLDRLSPQRTIVISEASAHPRVFRTLESPVYLCSSIFPLGETLEQAVGFKGKLGTGGSVSTTAWDLARLLGANPIYCIGLDLGFPDRRTHVRGSFFEERSHVLSRRTKPAEQHSFEYVHDAEPFEVPANDGGRVLTDQRMMIYTWWFSNQAKIHQDVETVNLSPHGVRIDGLRPASLEDVLSLPPRREEIDVGLERLREGTRARVAPEGTSVWAFAAELANRLEELAEIGRDGLRKVEHLSRRSSPDLSVLDEVDRRLATFEYKDIVGFLMQSVADDLQERSSHHDLEAALDSARILYRGLVEATEYHVRLLRRAPELADSDARMEASDLRATGRYYE